MQFEDLTVGSRWVVGSGRVAFEVVGRDDFGATMMWEDDGARGRIVPSDVDMNMILPAPPFVAVSTFERPGDLAYHLGPWTRDVCHACGGEGIPMRDGEVWEGARWPAVNDVCDRCDGTGDEHADAAGGEA